MEWMVIRFNGLWLMSALVIFPKATYWNTGLLLVGTMFCCLDHLIFCCFYYSSEWAEFSFVLEYDTKCLISAWYQDGCISELNIWLSSLLSMGLHLCVQYVENATHFMFDQTGVWWEYFQQFELSVLRCLSLLDNQNLWVSTTCLLDSLFHWLLWAMVHIISLSV